jgi:hypothetical protein
MRTKNWVWTLAVLFALSLTAFLFVLPAAAESWFQLSPAALAPAAADSSTSATISHAGRPVAAYSKLPLSFEANRGQTDPRVRFISPGDGYALFLTGNEAVLALSKPSAVSGQPAHQRNHRFASRIERPAAPASAVLRMRLAGTNSKAEVTGLEELSGKSHYFLGNDPKKWRINVPNYARVKCESVYPGVDLIYYGNQRELEFDFVVGPGADPGVISFDIHGAEKAEIDSVGDLVLQAKGADVRLRKPLVYQTTTGNGRLSAGHRRSSIDNRQYLAGRFVLLADNRITFEVAAYDKTKPLVIDPVLSYSSFLGGSGVEGGSSAVAIAVDASGNAYVASGSTSLDFPTTDGTFQPAFGGAPAQCMANCNAYYECGDAVVVKVDPTGSRVVYATYLGGNHNDLAYGLAVDSSGNAYVTGITNSADFPTTPGAFQLAFGGGDCEGGTGVCGDVFVTKINPSGSGLLYSTYLGGEGCDYSDALVVDSDGSAYVTGVTVSADFPTTPGALQPAFQGAQDAFVTKLDPQGANLDYSTYLGGFWEDSALGIAVDIHGNAYVTGWTMSFDFPTTPSAFQLHHNPYYWDDPLRGAYWDYWFDAFVAKLNPTGNALLYSTYLGGDNAEMTVSIAADAVGNAYVVGFTGSSDFPTTAGAFQTNFGNGAPCFYDPFGCTDAFVSKIDTLASGAQSLAYSTYLGGTGTDWGCGIAVDSAGSAYVVGKAGSPDFPVLKAVQQQNAGGGDVFVTKLNPAGSALTYSTYLGGSHDELADFVAIDSSGKAYVAGWTQSANFPTTPGVFQPGYGGGQRDLFVTKIDSRTFAAQVQAPIAADGSSVFNARRGVVRVRFTLTADGAPTCDLYPATIALFRTSGLAQGRINEGVYAPVSETGSNFRIAGCQYQYNLAASSLGPGAYRVEITVGGVLVGTAAFALK